MRIRNQEDFWSGVLFMAIGIGFAVAARRYDLGTLRSLGPGWFPTAVGSCMAVLGGALLLKALGPSARQVRIGAFGWRGAAAVLAALVVFAVALPHLGIIVSLAALVFVATLAGHDFSLRDGLLATVVILLGSLIFVMALGIQVQVWPVFLGS